MTDKEKIQAELLGKVVDLLVGKGLSTAETVGILEVAKSSLILSAGGIVK